jgi:hypothetical protein
LKGLNVSTPEEALEKLLFGGNLNTKSEGTSAPVEEDKELQLEQELWEARFKDEFLQHDVLDVMDSDPHAYFGLKALLCQLQNTRTSEALLFLVSCFSLLLTSLTRRRFKLMPLYRLTPINATSKLLT